MTESKALENLKYAHAIDVSLDLSSQAVHGLWAEIETRDKRIAELESAQRWIPVSERLPQNGMRVLFYNNFTKNIHKGWFSCDEWTSDIGIFYNGDKLKRITHWAALPESPNDTQTDTFVYGKEREK